MAESRDSEFDARLKRLEAAIAALERSVDALRAERGAAPSRAPADPLYEQVQRSYNARAADASRASSFPEPPIAPRRREQSSGGIDPSISSWFASRNPEWWLSRVGIGFVVLAVLLLYLYAIDKGWITPVVRVFTGVTVGALLFIAATRVRTDTTPADSPDLGFRELLLGGGLAVWYVTAYAAAVWYQLISIPTARLVFFVIGIISTWIALQERRQIFALVAVAAGFATPFILPAPVHSLTELSLYLGAVTAIGLIIYLMRGWQLIVWITFIGFWSSVNAAVDTEVWGPAVVVDSFDSTDQWSVNPSKGVDIAIRTDTVGLHARAMRLDFDFHGHSGYAIVHRAVNITLPPKYEFSFWIKGNAPPNTLEFKLVDSTQGVWWSRIPAFRFTPRWQEITRSKWEIAYAFGPTRTYMSDFDLKRISAIEFAISTTSGGKGSVWLDDLALAPRVHPARGSIALAILVLTAVAALIRAASLRRRLLLLGSPRYTPAPVTGAIRRLMEAMDSLSKTLGGVGRSAPDSLIVWVLILMSPLLAVVMLEQIWPQPSDEIWGAGLVLLGVGAFALSRRPKRSDAEINHVALTASVLWGLIGVALLAPTPEYIPACALMAALVFNYMSRDCAGPRALAKLAIGLALMAVAGHELSFPHTGLVHLRWVLSGIVTVGVAAFIARKIVADPAQERQGMVLGAASYATALIVLWSALNPVWAPLVTTSYAVLGAVLLIMSRREGARPLLRYLGGATMVIVVGRLLLVDLSTVDTIWRVLLFLVCGALFLYTGYRMQPRRD